MRSRTPSAGFAARRNCWPGNCRKKASRTTPTSSLKKPTACAIRSEEHTSELQSLMRSSYAVLCWKNNKEREQKITNLNPNDQQPNPMTSCANKKHKHAAKT